MNVTFENLTTDSGTSRCAHFQHIIGFFKSYSCELEGVDHSRPQNGQIIFMWRLSWAARILSTITRILLYIHVYMCFAVVTIVKGCTYVVYYWCLHCTLLYRCIPYILYMWFDVLFCSCTLCFTDFPPFLHIIVDLHIFAPNSVCVANLTNINQNT